MLDHLFLLNYGVSDWAHDLFFLFSVRELKGKPLLMVSRYKYIVHVSQAHVFLFLILIIIRSFKEKVIVFDCFISDFSQSSTS